jgi:hypothetical protein
MRLYFIGSGSEFSKRFKANFWEVTFFSKCTSLVYSTVSALPKHQMDSQLADKHSPCVVFVFRKKQIIVFYTESGKVSPAHACYPHLLSLNSLP